MPQPHDIAAVFIALKARTIRREDAVDLLVPLLDQALPMELIPVIGPALELATDLLARPMAAAAVNAALRAWAKEKKKKAAKVKK